MKDFVCNGLDNKYFRLLDIMHLHHTYSTLPLWHKHFIFGKSPEEERSMLLWRNQRSCDNVLSSLLGVISRWKEGSYHVG